MAAQIARVVGGAGTGKTTALMDIMAKLLDGPLTSPEQIGFVSFTRIARHEAAERAAAMFAARGGEHRKVDAKWLQTEGWFRTLHSVCLRCLDSPKGLLSGNKDSRQWIRDAIGVEIDFGYDADEGDLAEVFSKSDSPESFALSVWDTARNRMQDLKSVWSLVKASNGAIPDLSKCREVIEKYEQRKRIDGRFDFVDLLGRFGGVRFLENGVSRCAPLGWVPPVPVWFFDEQQDASALLDTVCRRLVDAESCRWAYLVGDPFQSIFGFAGADSRCFRGWDVAKERTMPKSYRCPAPILEMGEAVLRQCSDYFDRGIAPADHAGEVRTHHCLQSAMKLVNANEEWLLLARSNFHASRLGAMLTTAGVPWFPTRGNGGWSSPVRNRAVLCIRKIKQREMIDGEEWQALLKTLKVKHEGATLFKRGAKSLFASVPEEWKWIEPHEYGDVGATDELIDLIDRDGWHELIPRGKAIDKAFETYGVKAMLEAKIRVGTIHSAKGAEADNVILLATISKQVMRSMRTTEGRDEELRLQYVGVTRTRRTLHIVNESDYEFRWKFPAR